MQRTFRIYRGPRYGWESKAKHDISHPLTRAAENLGNIHMSSHGRPTFGIQGVRNISSWSKFSKPKRNVLFAWSKPRLSLPGARSLTSGTQTIRSKTVNLHRRFFSAEARKKRQQRRRFIRWWTVTSLAVIIGGVASKIRYERGDPPNEYAVKPSSWTLYAYSTLPLKAISRLWGQINQIDLPVWFRSPSYKLYSYVFGVNLDEMAEPNLETYSNLSEFFYRELKPGVRPISDTDLVSPADGKVLGFGVVTNGQIEQVKDMTYSVDALLGTKENYLAAPSQQLNFDQSDASSDEIFAKSNGIEGLMNVSPTYKDKGDGTDESASFGKELSVVKELAPIATSNLIRGQDTQLYFTVIYLAPGDYHHFHSPTSWVSTLRRHFIGELFSVAPFFQKTLQGLFVLNERVALLGYWKYGFFSMIPVGATNVGSIVINFDKDLKTNERYENEVYQQSSVAQDNERTPLLQNAKKQLKKLRKNTVYEATYTKASKLLGGFPLSKGQEMGGFKLGSTVVLVFEAPKTWKFALEEGQKVQVGQPLGNVETV